MVTMTCPDFAADIMQAFDSVAWSLGLCAIAACLFGYLAGRFLADRGADA